MKLRVLTASVFSLGVITAVSSAAQAQVNPYLGEVTLTAGFWCPRDFAEADGSILRVGDYPALFSLYGSVYGGNGTTSFALPDLRGRTPVGRSDALPIGSYVGAETAALTVATMPAHSHSVDASNRPGTLNSPDGADLAEFAGGAINGYSTGAPGSITMEADAIGMSGGSAASFNIRQPYLVMVWCISMDGVMPPRG